ncbi:MAG: sensor histidine kinase [Polyangia bacterium]
MEERRKPGGGDREGFSPREAIRLHERLARAVTTREEGVVLAQHLCARTRRKAVVMARAEIGWRIAGAVGLAAAIDTEIDGDPAVWLRAQASGDWRGHDLCHGRRVVGRAFTDGEVEGATAACRLAAPFFAARRSRATDAQAQLGLHISQISHDMRQPLSVITLSVDLLEDVPAARPILDRLRRARRDLVAFLEDLLAFAAAPASTLRELPLAPLVEQLVEDYRERAQSDGLTLRLALSAEPFITGDARRLGRALGNILSNAFEASPQGGEVCVRLAADATGAILEVSDDGPGVDPILRDRAFEPFVTSRPDGTGLGLAVVRQVVRAHGGEVGFVDGARTTVRVRLPLAHAE